MNRKPTIYTVATAHLDTVWNWDFEETITKYIPKTLDVNFDYFKRYPEYVFSFEGAYRYELMEEYYPERFEELKKYIAENRWFVTGSAYENGDVNVPSPEALFRNILYGNSYFYHKFGKKSVDIYLPDCFGFGYALPSVIKHAGLKGFTTQKLTWSSAYGIPFDLGLWQGVDGSKIYASLDAQDYNGTLKTVREHKNAKAKLENNIEKFDLPFTYLLHGIGDRGGAPRERSVKTVVNEYRKNGESDITAEIASVDKVFRVMDDELTDEQKAKLPVWNNELVSTDHGVGGYTSRSIGKRWNKANEQLADGAERMSVLANWIGAADYPQNVIDTAWKRVIAHQFHDDLPGTSLQHVYKRSWNDYSLSLNNFANVYESAACAIAENINVPFKKGFAVIVTNPTGWERSGAVSCKSPLSEDAKYVKVKNADGKEVPSQLDGDVVSFTATVCANGYSIYCITEANKPYAKSTKLSVTERTLENKKYRVQLDENGDISSIYDKEIEKELLKSPVRMAVHKYNGSNDWPAWEFDYPEVMAKPIEYAISPAFKIVKNGAALVSIETKRVAGESAFVQTISLDEAGTSIRVDNEIEWRGNRRLLKTPFTFTVDNETASYDLGLGVIKRGLNTPKLYEVPGQNFADISDDEFGVSVLSDCKFGWDHPTADTIRLTGIHTPRGNYVENTQKAPANQGQMDLGRNRYAFGIFSHAGSDLSASQAAGVQFVQPMRVFAAPLNNSGVLPSEYSFASVSESSIIIRAIKKEQFGERVVIRVNEGAGKTAGGVALTVANGIEKAWSMNASEEELEELEVKNGKVIFDIGAYEPKTFAVVLKAFDGKAKTRESEAVQLPYNVDVTSSNNWRRGGILKGNTIPSELFPKKVSCKNTVFTLTGSKNNAVKCGGQSIKLPKGAKSVKMLVTSVGGDKNLEIRSGSISTPVYIPDCCEAIGAWDLYSMHEKGYVKQCVLAKEFTHMHDEKGDIPAKQCYLFMIEIPAENDEIALPSDSDILVFAMQAEFEEAQKGSLAPMYDVLEKEEFEYVRSKRDDKISKNHGVLVTLGKSKLFKKYIDKL